MRWGAILKLLATAGMPETPLALYSVFETTPRCFPLKLAPLGMRYNAGKRGWVFFSAP